MEEFYTNIGGIDDTVYQNIKTIRNNIAKNATLPIDQSNSQEGVFRGMVKLIYYQMEGLYKGADSI